MKYLSEKVLADFRGQAPKWGPIGEIVYLRTYSRWNEEQNRRENWDETVERTVDWSMGLHQGTNGFLHTEAEELFKLWWNLDAFPAGRSLWVGGTEYASTRGFGQFNCFRSDTEFLTKEGIKKFSDFQDGDKVTVLSKGSAWKEATVKNFGKSELYKLTLRRGKTVEEIYTTANHRWLIKDGRNAYKEKTTLELTTKTGQSANRRGDILPTLVSRRSTNLQPCKVGIQHGIVFGDGSKDSAGDTYIKLCGDSDTLQKFFNTGKRVKIGSRGGTTYYDQGALITGLPWNWKDLPDISANKEYLLGFLMGWFAADGSLTGSNTILSSSSRKNMEWARSAFQLLGILTSKIRVGREKSPFDGSDKPLYNINLYREFIPNEFFLKPNHKFTKPKRPLNWRVDSIESTGIVEDVWCVQEPSTETFTLSNGVLTRNCSFLDIQSPNDLAELTYLLMSGSGVGFRVTNDNIAKLNENFPLVSFNPKLIVEDYNYVGTPSKVTETSIAQVGETFKLVVGDSREGWSQAVVSYIEALTGKYGTFKRIVVNVDYVRPLGSRLSTFGGHASGPEPLISFFKDSHRVLLSDLLGWTSVKALDICNMIGRTVVAGGSRRSAQIALGDADDQEYINAKIGDWEETAPWRSQSNNTVVFREQPTRQQLRDIFERIMEYGEPGFLNEVEAQRRRPNFRGINPCGEILLDSNGLCNLTTINLMGFIRGTKQIDWNGLERAIQLQARHNLRVTNVELELHNWNQVQKRDRLIGMSFTGFGDMVDKLNMSPRNQRKLLKWLQETARDAANDYASHMGIPQPLLATTVKPEGTVTQLPGVSSGVHPNFGPQFIRRVRISEVDAVAQALQSAGFKHERDNFNHNTLVFDFPIQTPAKKFSYDYSAVDMLNRYKLVMDHYVEHNCSITVYLEESEIEPVIDWLMDNWNSYVAVSFLPKSTGKYEQMPYEAITKKQFEKLKKDTPEFSRDVLEYIEGNTMAATEDFEGCDQGVCPIR